MLGKFYLFRPSSLILLLWLMLVLAAAVESRAAGVDAARGRCCVDRPCVPVSSGGRLAREVVAKRGV